MCCVRGGGRVEWIDGWMDFYYAAEITFLFLLLVSFSAVPHYTLAFIVPHNRTTVLEFAP